MWTDLLFRFNMTQSCYKLDMMNELPGELLVEAGVSSQWELIDLVYQFCLSEVWRE